jgi:hypothetical protein
MPVAWAWAWGLLAEAPASASGRAAAWALVWWVVLELVLDAVWALLGGLVLAVAWVGRADEAWVSWAGRRVVA